jgi:hypothetical protein
LGNVVAGEWSVADLIGESPYGVDVYSCQQGGQKPYWIFADHGYLSKTIFMLIPFPLHFRITKWQEINRGQDNCILLFIGMQFCQIEN